MDIRDQFKFSISTVALGLAFWAGGDILLNSNYWKTINSSAIAQEISDRDLELIENLIFDNVEAYNQEDLEGVMNSIHPDAPNRGETQEMSEYAFLMYDLHYETNALELVEISPSEAVIRVTLTATKIDGAEFQDNRSVSLQTLRKYNEEWKFFDLIEIEEIEYLNISF